MHDTGNLVGVLQRVGRNVGQFHDARIVVTVTDTTAEQYSSDSEH